MYKGQENGYNFKKYSYPFLLGGLPMTELEKIDVLRERLGLSYQESKEALDNANGDLIEALINMEQKSKHWENKFTDQSGAIVRKIKEIIQQGNVTKVKIKKDDETVLEIPATVGALGLVGVLASTPLTVAAGIGTVAAMMNQYKLEIVKDDGQTEEEDLF
jgi:DNA-binding transcriptional MerR regulator